MKKGLALTLALAVVVIAGYLVIGEMHQGFVMGLIPKPGN
jgi:hypothetical protein